MSTEKNDPMRSLTTMIPVVLLGVSAIFLMEYFNADGKDQKPSTQPGQEQVVDSQTNGGVQGSGTKQEKPGDRDAAREDSYGQSENDFVFSTLQTGETVTVDGGYYVAVLNNKGGRIDRFYLESNDNLKIPSKIIDRQDDPLGRKYSALEITRNNGLDFQPHIYYWDDVYGNAKQVGEPPLNAAQFTGSVLDRNEKTGIQQIEFTTPLQFKGHRLELTKVYRFFKDEYFFRQITILRNLEDKPFVLGGDLFFKPFGDIGPTPESQDSRILATYGRFYFYNDSLEHSANLPGGGGGGCGMDMFGCGDPRKGDVLPYREFSNSLQFLGSTSRYFFGYSNFLAPEGNNLNKPDGLVLVKKIDPQGKMTFTTLFADFRLAPSTGSAVHVGTAGGNVGPDGSFLPPGDANFGKIKKAQMRDDALVLDQQIYFGVRRDESHMFNNPDLAVSEFGEEPINQNVRDVIYSSGFLAIFSKVKDMIVWLMRFLYNYIGNYGWVIIIIAVGFKLLTWPLNQMQAKSMKKMSSLKPQMDEINEKYKDDPNEKQKRIMELYKKNNINPAKGCLPIVIQIPIFIALYSAFSESVELWKSPFIWWMTDLSQPDTIYVIKDLILLQNFHVNILPVFMVASQLLQQMTTTVAADPQQKMVMYIMPVVMIFFFWTMPSGVTLYWTVQNVVTVLWQVIGARMSKDEEQQTAA